MGRATKIEFNYIDGKDKDKQVASVSGNLSQLVERVDVMAEIPQFVKNIVSGVAEPDLISTNTPTNLQSTLIMVMVKK